MSETEQTAELPSRVEGLANMIIATYKQLSQRCSGVNSDLVFQTAVNLVVEDAKSVPGLRQLVEKSIQEAQRRSVLG